MMVAHNEMVVLYKDGAAEVDVGVRTIRVGRRDADDSANLCPVELVTSALGT